MDAQRASLSGSLWGRFAFIGKAVCGKVRVAFNSGTAADIFTPEIVKARWDSSNLFNSLL
jgi:hypothetical protein